MTTSRRPGDPIRLTPETIRQALRDMMASGAFNYPRDDTFPVPSTEWRYREGNEAGGSVMAVAKSTIQLETGEQRDGMTASSRVFFVYVTPTGAEMPISKCPGIKREWSRSNGGGFAGDNRTVITEYEVKSATTLKMVNLQSQFGKPKRVVNLMIDVNPEEATISLQGLGGFGLFKGRGKVNPDRSTYFVNRETFKLTETVLKEHFGLKILQPSLKAGAGGRVRSLIFE